MGKGRKSRNRGKKREKDCSRNMYYLMSLLRQREREGKGNET